jgi:hypothetical protein
MKLLTTSVLGILPAGPVLVASPGDGYVSAALVKEYRDTLSRHGDRSYS